KSETIRTQLEKTDKDRHEALCLSAGLALDRGLKLCEEEEVGHGLLWLARAAEIAPADAADLQHAVRANLAAWHRQLPVRRAFFPPQAQATAKTFFISEGKTILPVPKDKTVRLGAANPGEPLGLPPVPRDMGEGVWTPPDRRTILPGQEKPARL